MISGVAWLPGEFWYRLPFAAWFLFSGKLVQVSLIDFFISAFQALSNSMLCLKMRLWFLNPIILTVNFFGGEFFQAQNWRIEIQNDPVFDYAGWPKVPGKPEVKRKTAMTPKLEHLLEEFGGNLFFLFSCFPFYSSLFEHFRSSDTVETRTIL